MVMPTLYEREKALAELNQWLANYSPQIAAVMAVLDLSDAIALKVEDPAEYDRLVRNQMN